MLSLGPPLQGDVLNTTGSHNTDTVAHTDREVESALPHQFQNACDNLNQHINQIDQSINNITDIVSGTDSVSLLPSTGHTQSVTQSETTGATGQEYCFKDTEQSRKTLHEIIHHPGVFHPEPVQAIVAVGGRAPNRLRQPNQPPNLQQNPPLIPPPVPPARGNQGNRRNRNMANRGAAAAAQAQLQGADPALVGILNILTANDARRDVSTKKFLMFPKTSFTGEDHKRARTHWSDFVKYLEYQESQNLLDRNVINDIKSMFKLTLTGHALAWFESEMPNINTERQLAEAFLKRFNVWGQTHRQQQAAWNKLSFNIQKDDVDIFTADLKLLARILGQTDDQILEKFK